MDKIDKLYQLYKSKGIITDATPIEKFRSATEEQKAKLYELGKSKNLFQTTDINTFTSAWGESDTDKKKEESVLFSREGGTLSATPKTEPQKPSEFFVKGKIKKPSAFNKNIEDSDFKRHQELYRSAKKAIESGDRQSFLQSKKSLDDLRRSYGDQMSNDVNLSEDYNLLNRLSEEKFKDEKQKELRFIQEEEKIPFKDTKKKQLDKAIEGYESDIKYTPEERVTMLEIQRDLLESVDYDGINEEVSKEYSSYLMKPIRTKIGMLSVPQVEGPANDAIKSAVDELVAAGKQITKEAVIQRASEIRSEELKSKKEYEAIDDKYKFSSLLGRAEDQKQKEQVLQDIKKKRESHAELFKSKVGQLEAFEKQVKQYESIAKEQGGLSDVQKTEALDIFNKYKRLASDITKNYSNIENDTEGIGDFDTELDAFKRNHTYLTSAAVKSLTALENIGAGAIEAAGMLNNIMYDMTGNVDFYLRAGDLLGTGKAINDSTQGMLDGVSKSKQLEDVKDAGDAIEWAGALMVENTPQILINVLTNGQAIPFLSASAAGEKYMEVYGDANYSNLQKYAASILVGAGTAVSEKLELAAFNKLWPSKRLAKAAIDKTGREAFEKSLSEGVRKGISDVFSRSKKAFIGVNQEGVSEVADQLSRNLVDKYVLDKEDVSITDGLGEAYLSGAVVGAGLGAAPHVFSSIVRPFVNDPNRDILKNVNKIQKLNESLATADEKMKPIIQERINQLRNKNEEIIQKAVNSFDALSPSEVKEAIKIYEDITSLKKEYSQIKEDTTIPPDVKEALLESVFTKYNSLVERRLQILKKAEENAVQEQTTSEVPVQPEAAVGEEVAQGTPEAEPEVAAEEEIDIFKLGDTEYELGDDGKWYNAETLEEVDEETSNKVKAEAKPSKKIPKRGSKGTIAGVKVTYPTMQEARERKAARNEAKYVEDSSNNLEEENTDVLAEDLQGEFGILTAENPMAQPLTEEENRQLNEKAEEWLKEKGYKPRRVTGKYGQAENSFFVKGLTKEDAIAFAKKFNQDSVAHSEGLVYQDGSMNPRVKSEDNFAFEDFTPESNFVSVIKTKDGLKTFEIGYDFDTKTAPAATTEAGQQQTLAAEQGTPTTIEGTGLRENIKKSIAKVFKSFDTKSFKNAKEMAAYAKAKFGQETGASDAARIFVTKDGKVEVLVNEELADDTAFGHEVWHAILLKAFGDNQAKFAEFRGAIDKTLRQNGYEDIADSLDEFSSQYTEEGEVPAEEYLAQLGGLMTSANIDLKNLTPAQRSLLQQIKDIINDFAIQLTGQPVFLKEATPETILDFMSTMSDMMAKGEDISGFFADEAGATFGPADVQVDVTRAKKKTFENNKYEVKQPVYKPEGGKATGFTFIADRMATGEWNGLDPKSGIKIKLMGGIGYPMLKGMYKKAGWAVEGGTVMSTFLRKIVNSKTGIGFPVIMSEYAHVSNLTFAKIFEAEMDWMVKSGQTTQEQQLENVNKYISEALIASKDLSPKMKPDPKTGKMIDKNANAPLRTFAIESDGKYTPKVYTSMDQLYKDLEGTFDARGLFMKTLIGVGVKNRYAKIEKYGFPDMIRVADEVSDPRLKGIPSGTSVSAIQFNKEKASEFVKDIESGAKLSEKHSAKSVGVEEHISYQYPVEGESLGWLPGVIDISTAEGTDPEVKKWFEDQRKKFEKGEISEAQLRSNVTSKARASMPEVELKTRAQKVEKIQKETNFVPVSFWVESLKGNVDYLDNVIEHILKARDILKSGKVPQRMTTKSYLITLASMGSGGGYYDNWKAKTGKTVEDIFIEKQKGRDWLRPEGAAAAFLSTPEGKTLVEKINEGTATKEEIKEIFDFVGTGRESSKTEYVISTIQSGGLKSMTDLFNKNKGKDFSELFSGAIKNLKGIGVGKTGFFNQYFGVSSRGVVDARQMNAWVAGQMKLTDEQKALKKKIESSPKLQAELLGKIEEVGIELGYPEDLAAYIAHHAIWDGIAKNITRHEGEYVVTRAQKAQPQTIPGYDRMIGEAQKIVEKSKKRGVSAAQIAENVINYIQKSRVYERADDLQREQIIRDARKDLGLRQKSAPSVDKLLGKIKDIKKVTVSEKSALKELLKAEAKGARTAVQARSQAAKTLNDMLKALEKKGSVTTAQVRAIMTRYSKVNFFSSSSMDNFVNYMAKVFSDAEYSDKLKTASKTANAIRRLSKNDSVQAGTKAVAKKFLEIDPRLVEDIDKYLEFAKALNDAVRTSMAVNVDGDFEVLLKKAIDYNEFQDYMETEIAAQEEYIKNQLAEIHKDLVDSGAIDASMSLADMKAIIDAINYENEDSLPSEEKERMIRAYLESVMDSYAGLIDYMLENSMDPFSLELISISDKDRQIISKFMKMDLNKLPLKEAYSVVEAIENFIVNKNVDNMGSILAAYEGGIDAESMQRKGTKARPIRSFFSKKFGRVWAEQIEQLQITMERMFGGIEKATEIMRKSGVLDISQGKTKAVMQSEKIINKYTEKFGKIKDFNSAENIFERKIISFMTRTINGSDIQKSIEFERRKRIVDETITAMENGSETEVRDAAIAREVYDKVLKEAKTPQEVASKSKDFNNEAVKFWIDEFSNIFDELQSVSRSVYNTILERDINYTPDRFKRFEGIEEIIDITGSSFAANNESYDTKKSGTLMANNRIKTLGKDPKRVLSFDFDTDMSNAMLNALIDINTAYAIRKAKSFYESDSFGKMVPSKDDRELIRRRVKAFITKTKRKEYVPQSELAQSMKAVNLMSQIAVGRALGSLAQVPKQTISVLANTMVNSDGKLAFVDVINAKDFIDNSGYSIALRGIASNADVQTINKMLERQSESTAQEFQRGLNKAAEMWLNSFIARPDVWAARLSWITYYKESLRKQGIDADNIDWSTHEMNQKAGDYAQAQVNRQQNYSDSDFAGELLGSKDPMKAYTRKVLFPYMTFVFNQKSRQMADIAILSNKTSSKADKAKARKSLYGLAAEMATYSLVGYFIKEVYAMIVNALTGGDDDEEDKDKRLKNHIKYSTKTMINDLLSPIPNITDTPIDLAINKIMKVSGVDEDAFSIPEDKDKSLAEVAVGPSSIMLEGMVNLERMSYAALTGTAVGDYKGKLYERELSKENQDLMKYVTVVYTAYLVGAVPADMGRISEQVYRRLLKDSKKEKGGGGEIKTSIDTKIK